MPSPFPLHSSPLNLIENGLSSFQLIFLSNRANCFQFWHTVYASEMYLIYVCDLWTNVFLLNRFLFGFPVWEWQNNLRGMRHSARTNWLNVNTKFYLKTHIGQQTEKKKWQNRHAWTHTHTLEQFKRGQLTW